nr:TrbG/VirB9 family P-type conjugative transfer protein [uncultured Rhodopila sp.]
MRVLTATLLASAALIAISHRTGAEEATADTEIRVVSYSPLKRTEVIGIVGQPTTFTFPRGESIYRVVQSGKPDKDGTMADAGWQGASPAEVKDTPLGNNLTLWPVGPGQSTMTVITMSPEGVQKVYPFRLVAIPDDAAALLMKGVVLNLIFQGTGADRTTSTTPAAAPGPAAVQALRDRQKARQAELEAAKERMRTDSFNGVSDGCHYIAKGRQPNAITPRCPLDNGEWTLMRFPGLSRKPAVYVVTGDDEERLARQHGDGDFVIVEEIAAHFRLRLGPDVLDIINQAYNAAGRPAGTGTTAPTVNREVLQARANR